jgi:hypothetical protein
MKTFHLLRVIGLILFVCAVVFLATATWEAQAQDDPTEPPYPPPPVGIVDGTPTTDQSPYPPPPITVPDGTFITAQPAPAPTTTPEPSQAAQNALAYLAEEKGLPLESLMVVGDETLEFPNLGRQIQAVTMLDIRPDKGNEYELYVDLDSGEMFPDLNALRDAEAESVMERYGKLEPALFDRLNAMKDAETIHVAIWAIAGPGGGIGDRQAAAYATLAAEYPEAKAAYAEWKNPWDIDDPQLSEKIYREYLQLMDAGVTQRLKPLLDYLDVQGTAYTTFPGLPVVYVTLSKSEVNAIAQRDEVGAIDLASEGTYSQAQDSAVKTDQTPIIWYALIGLLILALLAGVVIFYWFHRNSGMA